MVSSFKISVPSVFFSGPVPHILAETSAHYRATGSKPRKRRSFPMPRFLAPAFCLLFLPALSLFGADYAYFEKHIRPALINHCFECHSDGKKVKGGLLLDRKSGWTEGGDSGPAIVPGKPDESLLIDAIRYKNPDTEMPPKGKLPDSVIAHFEKWIASGAPDPRDKDPHPATKDQKKIDIEKARRFWSFQPITNPAIPKGSENTAIDRFVSAKLDEKNLSAVGPTTPEMRIRRAKTDLTGLLPTISEQNEFLAEPTEKKFAEMVDRWLASPAFGERWGRHWLDLARYADTSGGGRAMPLPEAWRFRDFVIDAFNKDLPLDELIGLHLAGDLLPYEDLKERERNLVATGFLVLGPHNYENQNKELLDLEIADEQIDTIGRAFLGMTIGCARCHDHKFDPIPTADYYSMAGIFLSTNSVTHSNVSRWHTEPIPPTKEMQVAKLNHLSEKEKIEKEVSTIKSRLAKLGRGSGGKMKSVPVAAFPGILIDDAEAEKVGEWMKSVSNPRFVGDNYIHDMQMEKGAKEVHYTHLFEKAGRYELRISYSSGSNRNPRAPVTVTLPGDIRKRYEINQILHPEHDKLFQTIGEFDVKKGDEIVVIIGNDSPSPGVVIADAVQWLPVAHVDSKTDVPEKQSKVTRAEIKKLEDALRAAEATLKKVNKNAPKMPTAMCAVDHPPEKIGDTEIRIRGVESNLGSKVSRGFLQVASREMPEIPSDASGRLEFAHWIVSPKNPLTARVLANRIWHHLMGRGIVASPDNFGITGDRPTDPALLDHLANRLIESGWSAKKLIREIILTNTYSRSTAAPTDHPGAQTDPDNYLLWRAHRRFLDAEVLRDGMLSTAESLNPESGGPSLPSGFKSEFGYKFKTLKRSVYVPVFRNKSYEIFGLFDFANPNFTVGKRGKSTIPTQALFLTNSPFVHQQAGIAASSLLQKPGINDNERVDLIFRKVLSRHPSPDEQSLSLKFLRSRGDTPEADDADPWAALIRSLFACVDYRILR